MAKTITTRWKMWTYDVLGNARDGYDVNNRYGHGEHELELAVETANAGTQHAFEHAFPTDKQIKGLFGVRCKIETEGDDVTIYVNRARDGRPIGELNCVSHESLSRIREGDPKR